jgi:serine/threonine protein kinase
MELLEGEELREQLRKGALAPRRVLTYARQIADGLASAHAKGIIHRDLKPENIFVTTDGRIKILDFGLAKLKEPPAGSAVATVQAPNTIPGVVMGTANYMAPEQVRGEEAEERSDIFSLGVILYEMLRGERPFSGDSAVAGHEFDSVRRSARISVRLIRTFLTSWQGLSGDVSRRSPNKGSSRQAIWVSPSKPCRLLRQALLAKVP